MAIHCFYHSADLDGHCSGAIVKYRLPEAIMHPINYGDEFPWNEIQKGDVVYMVDFALQPFTDMEKLWELCGDLIWLDHHDSSINECEKVHMNSISGHRRTTEAACAITWRYLFPDKPVPLAVKLLSLYDSWTYQGHGLEPMVLPFQMRMRMENLDPKEWDHCGSYWIRLFQHHREETNMTEKFSPSHMQAAMKMSELVNEGKLLLRYDEEQKRRYVQTYGFETMLEVPIYPVRGSEQNNVAGSYKAIALNIGMSNSKVFDSVWRKKCIRSGEGPSVACPDCHGTGYIEPYDLMITFCRRTDRKWNVSLYSTKSDIDCGAIAKNFGGGGHKGAAGFQCDKLPFEY